MHNHLSQDLIANDSFVENQQGNKEIKLLLIERSTLVKDALKRTITTLSSNVVIAEANSIAKVKQAIGQAQVVLLGTSITPKDCLGIARIAQDQAGPIGMVVLTIDTSPEIAHLLSLNGFHGILDETATVKDLEAAITASIAGNMFHSRHIHESAMSFKKYEGLTATEMQVFGLLLNGESNYQMALKQQVTIKTVEAHLTRIYRKLDVSCRVQAILRAREIHLTLD